MMSLNTAAVPFRYAQLIIRPHNQLTEAEADELDNRIAASDENGEVFETLTEGMEDRIFNAEAMIVETEDLLDTWMMAGLMARKIPLLSDPPQVAFIFCLSFLLQVGTSGYCCSTTLPLVAFTASGPGLVCYLLNHKRERVFNV